MKLWLDGKLLNAAAAGIAPTDRGLLLGDGLYETLLVQECRPQHLDAHLARLRHGASVIGLDLPPVDLAAAMQLLLAANDIAEGSLRLTVTRGSGPRGIAPPVETRPTVLITATAAGVSPPPANAVIARRTRRNEHSPLAGIKSLNCLDAIVARIEARDRGADEAILLNTAGRAAEATAANLFVLRDGALLTPPLAEGVLPGITRARVLAAGAIERPLTVDLLAQAEEVFLTSSLGLRSLASLEGRALPSDAVAMRLRHSLGFVSA